MKFTPVTEDITVPSLLSEGVYEFVIVESENCVSKSGNEMIKIKLLIKHEGHNHFIYDYLLEAMPYKLRHFAEVTGLFDKYEHGEINDQDSIQKSGHVEIIVQKGKPNPNGGDYPDRNAVKDYLKKSLSAGTANTTPVQSSEKFVSELDDDIPF